MTWSRRQFLTGVGVLAAVSGTAGRVVAKTLNINGVRYGMVHDESLCIGCTACMDCLLYTSDAADDCCRV